VQRALIGEIVSRLEGRGLKLIALKMIRITPELAARHYAEHNGKPFFDGLVKFITSGRHGRPDADGIHGPAEGGSRHRPG
jgi:nucleoside-diphosphate kinase